MDKTPENQKSPDIMLSDYSLDSPFPIAASPTSPVQHRPGYNRVASFNEVDTSYNRSEVDGSERDARLGTSAPSAVAGKNVELSSQGRGLGIGIVETRRPPSISQGAVGSPRSPPPSSNPLLSPTSTQIGSNSRGMDMHFEDEGMNRKEHRRNESEGFEPFTASSDRERLHGNAPSADEMQNPTEFEYRVKQRHNHGRANWQSIAILSLALYSTVGSGIWLAAAMIKPRWGRRITTTGNISPATASLLCTALAKTIELSFVTVFVAFLGQVLSRRAFISRSKGITVADMSMRAWVMQPGTMITNWQTVRYAVFSYLGIVSLLAALMAMLYTTASDALVSPKLKYGRMESRLMYGKVATQFANPDYLKDRCKTPISKNTDPVEYENSCVGVEHAGQSYHNYQQFITQWTDNIDSGNGSATLEQRPRPMGMLYDNTTVVGSWIHEQNLTALSQNFSNRIINNVSMAMPHAGVFSAARDPLNDILQPQDLSGLGEYTIRASVPSPAVNVLCANANGSELDPLVYTQWWKGAKLNSTAWPENHGLPDAKTWLDQNITVLDDVFEWGEKFGRKRPIFAKYPLPYNTILNTSKTLRDSIYLLATTSETMYTVCSIRGSLTPNCSTEYFSSMSGGVLSTKCEDPTDHLSYHKSEPLATNGILNRDWINVAFSWITAISLNDGIEDGQASIARILTQLVLANPFLNPSLPSIAETLAVLSGCTLLLSTLESPYIHYWNYSDSVPTLKDPQYQAFNASLRFQDYTSSGTQPWQNMFYIVLFVVFVTNVICLAYLGFCRGLVTDFIEPQNLFNLSLNSPPSKTFDGNLGSGAEKEQLRTNWIIKQSAQDQFYIQEGEKQPVRRKDQKPMDYEMQSPIAKMYSRLAASRNSVF